MEIVIPSNMSESLIKGAASLMKEDIKILGQRKMNVTFLLQDKPITK